MRHFSVETHQGESLPLSKYRAKLVNHSRSSPPRHPFVMVSLRHVKESRQALGGQPRWWWVPHFPDGSAELRKCAASEWIPGGPAVECESAVRKLTFVVLAEAAY